MHGMNVKRIHNLQNKTITKWEECGPCPVFASYTLAFALQLRKKHGKTSVRVAEECQLARKQKQNKQRKLLTLTKQTVPDVGEDQAWLMVWRRCGLRWHRV
jgi:hypothetical protein